MSELAPHALVPGVRFALKNAAYEVSFVDGGKIRYASCKGGKQHQIPLTVFWKLVEDEEIGFLELGATNLSQRTDGPVSRVLTDAAREEIIRRIAYVKHALESRRHPTARSNLNRAIARCYEQEVEREAVTGKKAGRKPGVS